LNRDSVLRKHPVLGRPGLKALNPGTDVRIAVDPEAHGKLSDETELNVGRRKLSSQLSVTSLKATNIPLTYQLSTILKEPSYGT
jgi:hypothetical protein